jgi:hypothetical protein
MKSNEKQSRKCSVAKLPLSHVVDNHWKNLLILFHSQLLFRGERNSGVHANFHVWWYLAV